MIFSPQAPTVLSILIAVLASIGVVAVIFLLIAIIVHFFKWRERKIQRFKYEIDAAQKTLLVIEKEKYDCQEKVARLEKYKDNLVRTVCKLDAAVNLQRQVYRKYDEDIQDLSQKVKDLEAAIKEKEDKLLKTIMIEIEIGSEKRRVSI